VPLGSSPGSHLSTGSDSRSRPSATSCSATVAMKVLVRLPARNRAAVVSPSGELRRARPLAWCQVWLPLETTASAPVPPRATSSSSRVCRRGFPAARAGPTGCGRAGLAVAGFAVAGFGAAGSGAASAGSGASSSAATARPITWARRRERVCMPVIYHFPQLHRYRR
jgi:hypothetical protein